MKTQLEQDVSIPTAYALLIKAAKALDCLCGCQCTCPENNCPVCGDPLEGSHGDFYQEKCPVCLAQETQTEIYNLIPEEGDNDFILVSKTILQNCISESNYQREYVQFLLGIYSEEEFMEIANKYAIPLNLQNPMWEDPFDKLKSILDIDK